MNSNYFVSTKGSDNNDGLSADQPFLTFEKAIDIATPNSTVEFGEGNYPIFYNADVKTNVYDRLNLNTVSGQAILDSRALINEPWTLVSGTTWKTDIVHRTPTVNGGTDSNTNNYSLWEDGEVLDWISPKDSTVSENIDLVEATPNSFTVHRNDSSISDPRFDTDDVDYTYYVNLADGANPNNSTIKVSDLPSNGKFVGGKYSNLVLYGMSGKDNISTTISPEGEVPTFKNSWWKDTAGHGSVGPMNVEGTHKVSGRPFIGDPKYEQTGRGLSGINLYTPTFYPKIDLVMENLDIQDVHNSLYGHGSGNQGYRSLDIGVFKAENSGTGLKFDPVDATSRKPFIVEDVTVEQVEFQDVDNAFSVDGDWTINGGSIELSGSDTLVDSKSSQLVSFTGTEPKITLKNVDFSFDINPKIGSWPVLATRASEDNHTTPILVFDNSHDISSTPEQKGKLARSTGNNTISEIDIRLINGSTVGSLLDQPLGTNFPAALTVEAGSTFGLGDRTGEQIIDDLTAAGVPHDISHQTTIVDRAGNILDNPGW